MSGTSLGRVEWSLDRDDEGHRTYTLKSLVKTTSTADGPAVAYFAAGLPAIGTAWSYGNDFDAWAFCLPRAKVEPVLSKERGYYYLVTNYFSTRPLSRCQDDAIENPIAEPAKISGSFVEYTKKAETRSDGSLILSSSHEKIKGLEKDSSRATVIIEINATTLGLNVYTELLHCLNDSTLWGLAARKVKFSRVSWERLLYGTCTFFYKKRMEFDIRFDGWDLDDIADTGFKVFDSERWPDTPSYRANPENYMLAVDSRGKSSPERVLLDGSGRRLTDPLNPVYLDPIELYPEANLLLLGIPSSF